MPAVDDDVEVPGLDRTEAVQNLRAQFLDFILGQQWHRRCSGYNEIGGRENDRIAHMQGGDLRVIPLRHQHGMCDCMSRDV